jgi:multiple sugar transport system substrate-binding protein
MTWDQIIELAKKLERTENGIEYHALSPDNIAFFASALSLPMVDPKTGRATLNTEGWKRAVEVYKQITDITGKKIYGNSFFLKDRNLAMLATYGNLLGNLEAIYNQGVPYNWDIASYPSFPEAPNQGREIRVPSLMITSTSKQKDAAFKVLSYLVSDENQLMMTRSGRLSALKDPKFKQNFGADLKSLQGKNVSGIFKSQPAPAVSPSQYTDLAQNAMNAAIGDIVSGTKDINTALREADEAANQAIAAAKQGQSRK